MRRSLMAARPVRRVVFTIALLLLLYLAAVALRPAIRHELPYWLWWFGRPDSMRTVGIVVAVLVTVCVLIFRWEGSHRLVGLSFTVVAVLITTSREISGARFGSVARSLADSAWISLHPLSVRDDVVSEEGVRRA